VFPPPWNRSWFTTAYVSPSPNHEWPRLTCVLLSLLMAQQRRRWSKSLHPWWLTLLWGKFPSESMPSNLAASLWTLLPPKSSRSTARKHSRVSSPLSHSYAGESKSLSHADPCELGLKPHYKQARGDSLDSSVPCCHRIHQRRRAQSGWRYFNSEPLIVSFVHSRQSEYLCGQALGLFMLPPELTIVVQEQL